MWIKLRIIQFLFIFIILILQAKNAHCRSWADRFQRLHILNRRGEYKVALHKNQRWLQKAQRKLGKNHPCTGKLYLTKAKSLVLLGRFSKHDSLISKGTSILSNTDSASMLLSGHTMAADAYLEYGIPRKAHKHLEKGAKVLQNTKRTHPKKQFLRVKARTLSKMGYHEQADSLFRTLIPYYKSRISRENVDRWHYFYRKRRYADLNNQLAKNLIDQGYYVKADSVLVKTASWIKSSMHPQDLAHVDNLILQAKLHTIYRQHNKANKHLEKAKKLAKLVHYRLRYLENSKSHFRLYEKTIRSNLTRGNKLSANRMLKILNVKTVRYYGENSVYVARKNILEAQKAINKGQFGKAEDILEQSLHGISNLPGNHPVRAQILKVYYQLFIRKGEKKKAEEYLDQMLRIEKALYGPEAPQYHRKKLQKAEFYATFKSNFQKALRIYQNSYDSVYRPSISPYHTRSFTIENTIASVMELTNRYDSARTIYQQNIKDAKAYYGDQNIIYASQLARLGAARLITGNYQTAKASINKALKPFNFKKNKNTIEHAQTLEILGRYYFLNGLYDAAERAWSNAEEIIAQQNKNSLTPRPPINEHALLYINQGEYSQTNAFLQNAIAIQEKRFGKENHNLVKPLIYMADFNITMGNYNEADNFLRRATKICTKTFGRNSLQYTHVLNYYGKFYAAIGDYEKAENTYNKVINKKKNHLRPNHIEIANALKELALAEYFNNKPFDTVEKHFRKSTSIIRQELGNETPQYASSLMNLAFFYIENNKTGQAEKLVDQAEAIWEETLESHGLFEKGNIKTPEILALRGDISYTRNNFREAISYYEDSRRHYERNYSKNHPKYVNVLSKLARGYYSHRETEKAISTLNTTTEIYLNYINKYFPALSRREKDKFWSLIKTDFELYKTLALRHHKEKPGLLSEVYNFTLSTKALLLNSSRKIRETILNSQDSTLKAEYKQWVRKKEQLTSVISMSKQQQEKKDVDPEELEKEIRKLEKSLSSKSNAFRKGFGRSQHTWEDVKENLSKGEMAVEIIRFRYFDQKFTDSIVYAALTVTSQTADHPQLTVIGDGNNLEGRNLRFYRNTMEFNIADHTSYKAYWQPLENITSGYNTIYISADGVYNQLNLETLQTSNNQYLLDKHNIIPVSNTRELVTERQQSVSASSNKTASLFGNPSFYTYTTVKDTILNISYDTSYVKTDTVSKADSIAGDSNYVSPPVRESVVIKTDTSREIQTKRVLAAGEPDQEQIFTSLPGAEKEVKELHNLLKQKNWKAKYYLGDSATEEKVKQLRTPGVFHVATHGFFAEQEKERFQQNFSAFNKSSLLQSPLLRSGLAFKSGGDILLKNPGSFNSRDGILTAYEAMNLRLDHTDLVVLSACETGRGKIKIGEGVYGLQRSFLVAGADHVIMSLFKVSDKVTRELMVDFYKKWLQSGDKRASFIQAKHNIKEKYDTPKYWGAFVMIGI